MSEAVDSNLVLNNNPGCLIQSIERIGVKTYTRTNKSQEGINVEHRKSRESNPVVSMVEGIPEGRSKSREINPVVSTVSYADIMIINILPG